MGVAPTNYMDAIPSKFSIYSNNSGVPGSELQSTTTFIYSGSGYFSGSFTKYDNSITSRFTTPQFKFDNPTVTLSANTTYWMVVKFVSSSSKPGFNNAGCTNSTSLKRKMSSDGASWTDWKGSSGNSEDENASYFLGHFLSD